MKTIIAITFTSLVVNTAIAKPPQKLAMLTLTTGTIPIFAKKKIAKKSIAKKRRKGRQWACLGNIDIVKRRAGKLNDIIVKSSLKYAVDANLIKAVIAVESCYNRHAVSPAGAQGLMQLIPATADRFGVSDSFNAKQNINAGTKYLRFLLKRYHGDLQKTTAAYNAGEGKVDRYNGIPPYKETRNYVKKVLRIYGQLSGQPALLSSSTTPVSIKYTKKGWVNKDAASYKNMSVRERAILQKIRSLGVKSAYKKGVALGNYKKPMRLKSRLSPRKQRKLNRLKELQRRLRLKRLQTWR